MQCDPALPITQPLAGIAWRWSSRTGQATKFGRLSRWGARDGRGLTPCASTVRKDMATGREPRTSLSINMTGVQEESLPSLSHSGLCTTTVPLRLEPSRSWHPVCVALLQCRPQHSPLAAVLSWTHSMGSRHCRQWMVPLAISLRDSVAQSLQCHQSRVVAEALPPRSFGRIQR